MHDRVKFRSLIDDVLKEKDESEHLLEKVAISLDREVAFEKSALKTFGSIKKDEHPDFPYRLGRYEALLDLRKSLNEQLS